MNRRDFVSFLGGLAALSFSTGCSKKVTNSKKVGPLLSENSLKPTGEDQLRLLPGMNYEVLLEWGQPIGEAAEFGFNNDYIAVLPTAKKDEFYMWVNHEYTNPLFVSGATSSKDKTSEQIAKEMASVGGSLLKIRRNLKTSRWEFVPNSGLRFDANSKIPFAKGKVDGSETAMGTMGNCAGGYTPWGTFLTCEENIDIYYGDVDSRGKQIDKPRLGWEKLYNQSPLHYGWVVEIDPKTASAKKHISLGRFAHESCTVVALADGRVAAYSGDDKEDEFLYRFISKHKNSLDEGELFVADIKNGKWLSLDIEKQPKLKAAFKDQTEVLCFCREAGKILGATPLDRPEDIEVHPRTGDVYIALTNNKKRMNFHGSILRLSPTDANHESDTFQASDFLVGGVGSGFSSPDNLAFDRKGNLWFTTDMSGSVIGKEPYNSFGNNGLYCVDLTTDKAGDVLRVAESPMDAELTGICFTPDGEGLFLAVQHPGELSKSLTDLTSHWPRGGSEIPRPSVVEIRGEALSKILS